MYESYWGLRERPFDETPDPRYLYRAAVAETYARLHYALHRAAAAVMLTGASGCGKTLLYRALIQDFGLDSTEVALLTNPSRQAPELLRELLLQIGEPVQENERSRLVHRLNEALYVNHKAGRRTLVIIDEAQLLEDPAVFEEIRLLLNFQLNDVGLLTLFLVGQPPLAERIGRFSELDERISARGVLRPLEQEQVGPYLAHRLGVAGRTAPVFSEDAAELIGQYSGGIPRRVNRIADLCLAIGCSRQAEVIEDELVCQIVVSEEASHV